MDNEKFQELVLKKLDVFEKKFEQNDRFQELVLNHMAHLTQDMTELKQTVGDINDRVGKLEVKVEHEVMGKINVLFDVQQQHTEQLNRIEEKVSTHEEFIIKRIK